MRKVLRFVALILVALVVMPLAAQMQKDSVDLDAVYKIKREAINDSQVMETLSYISDVYGGRLTGSPHVKLAGDWGLKQKKDWGIKKTHHEFWVSAAVGSTSASTPTSRRPLHIHSSRIRSRGRRELKAPSLATSFLLV